jgi:hypothetical protein
MDPRLIIKANRSIAQYLANVPGLEDSARRLIQCNHDTDRGAPRHCRSPYCIVCKHWKAYEESSLLGVKLRLLHSGDPSIRLLFATCTVAPCRTEQIRNRAKRLLQYWRTLSRRLHPHPRVRQEVAAFIIGGFRWLEISRDRDDVSRELVHTHNVLLMRASYAGRNRLSRNMWTALWLAAGGDLARSLDVQPVRSIDATARYLNDSQKLTSAALLAIEDPARHCNRVDQLRALRHYQPWGQLADDPPTEMEIQTGLFTDRDQLRRTRRTISRRWHTFEPIPVASPKFPSRPPEE